MAKFVLLVVMLFLLTCANQHQRPMPSVDPRVAEVWERNDMIVERALKGDQEGDNFVQACEFFEHLTGVKVHINFFTLGISPTRETRADLEKVRVWYRVNKNRLYWDSATRSVRLRAIN
jgi:hypothetical protein